MALSFNLRGRGWTEYLLRPDDFWWIPYNLTDAYISDDIYHIFIIYKGVCIPVALLGIIGAALYNKALVLIMGVWYLFDFCLRIYILDVSGIILAANFAYPYIAYFVALKKGQVTRENIKRERHCPFFW